MSCSPIERLDRQQVEGQVGVVGQAHRLLCKFLPLSPRLAGYLRFVLLRLPVLWRDP
jgi:hypothetical protein